MSGFYMMYEQQPSYSAIQFGQLSLRDFTIPALIVVTFKNERPDFIPTLTRPFCHYFSFSQNPQNALQGPILTWGTAKIPT